MIEDVLTLSSVRLTDGPLALARDANSAYLHSLEPDRLLAGYHRNAGLEPLAPVYGGWEATSLGGHTLGHYLSAISYRVGAGDTGFAAALDRTLSELGRCSSARADRFLGGMPDADRVFGELREGIVRSAGFDLNDCWVPWYNMHKLFAGLVDAATFAGRSDALEMAVRLGDWAISVTGALDEDAWQRMLACEHGGMNDALARLAVVSGEERFLDLARRFYHRAVLDPLADGVDNLAGLHANTQIPKVLGCASLARVTGEPRYRAIAENFFAFVTRCHSYAIGGHGLAEHFGTPDQLAERLGASNCEGCNTVNMVALAHQLFALEPRAALFDYVERALYNHTLAAQQPQTGMLSYFVPLHNGDFRAYSTPFDSFWCCVGTGIEAHARHELSVAHVEQGVADDTAHVHLYEPSEVRVRAVIFGLSTNLPFGGANVRITVQGAGDVRLRLRMPAWRRGVVVSVNSVPVEPRIDHAGYLEIARSWVDGDTVDLIFPTALSAEALPDAPGRIALVRGPAVLAADLGPAPSWTGDEPREAPDALIPPAPVIVDNSAAPESFVGDGDVLRAEPTDVELKPFARLHGRRYAVYVDRFAPDEWASRADSYRADERRDHAKRTRIVDEFWPAQMQAERDHEFVGENTVAGERSAWRFREANAGGRFTFTLRCDSSAELELLCKWGPPPENDVDFDVCVGDSTIARVQLPAGRHRHIDAVYPIPIELTREQGRVTITIRASHNTPSAPLFLCRLQKTIDETL